MADWCPFGGCSAQQLPPGQASTCAACAQFLFHSTAGGQSSDQTSPLTQRNIDFVSTPSGDINFIPSASDNLSVIPPPSSNLTSVNTTSIYTNSTADPSPSTGHDQIEYPVPPTTYGSRMPHQPLVVKNVSTPFEHPGDGLSAVCPYRVLGLLCWLILQM